MKRELPNQRQIMVTEKPLMYGIKVKDFGPPSRLV